MDFALSRDQQMLQSTAREFFLGRGLTQPARRVMAGEAAVVGETWRQMAEVGFLGVGVPAAYGGAELGPLSLVPILEEAGRALAVGPLPEALGFAAPVLAAAGSESQRDRYLGGLASGGECITLALYEGDGDPCAGDVELAADRVAGGYRLRGRKRLVPHAGEATTLLVLARTTRDAPGRGLTLFAVDAGAAVVTPVAALDQSRPLYEVEFRETAAERVGPEGAGFPLFELGLQTMASALVAMSVGGMQRCLEMSAEHAKTRVQFGQPIGRFQAIKHRIVDMWVDLETARSLSHYAAWALEEHAADRVTAGADAKAFTGPAFVRCAAANIQNHGGMGFTWEADPHLFLKRAKAWEGYGGTAETHLERVAASLHW